VLDSGHARDDWRIKIWRIHWGVLALILAIASIGFAMLYSAADGSLVPWAGPQIVRFSIGLLMLVVVALVDIRVWLRHAYVIYAVSLVLLAAVELFGSGAMGAQRWIAFGGVQVQPAEAVKIALVLALARYFHGAAVEDLRSPLFLIPPLALVLVPVALILRQPDLGTAVVLLAASAALFFLAGVRMWMFATVGLVAAAAIPIAWGFLYDYQKRRILTFLNPERDPLGSGYHILQSKIALGSGGLFGKGFLAGSQSHLNFVPEKQTDFIFAMFAEEFGLLGGLALLSLYGLLALCGYGISMRSRSQFGRLLGLGITTTYFLYVFVNIAMVTGLVPVVGVPLPFVSYGGTAMLSLLFGFGLVLNVGVHRETKIGRLGLGE